MNMPLEFFYRARRGFASPPPPATEPVDLGGDTDVDAWPMPDSAVPVHVIGEHGEVRLSGGRFSIAVDGGEPAEIRLDDVSALLLHGNTNVTTPALHAAMRRGISILWHGFDGRLIGQTLGMAGGSSALREAQYRAAADPAVNLMIARAFVSAKLANARRLLLRRFGQDAPAVRMTNRCLRGVPSATTLDQLRGWEGAAADAYFSAWPDMISPDRPHLMFNKRSRRPPADPANAAISYLYAVLHGRCVAATVAVGLDPMVGFLHARRAGRAALALDFMEPFRAAVVDAALIAAFNNGEFPTAAFTPPGAPGEGWRLNSLGRRTALKVFERRLSQPLVSRGEGSTTYRDVVTRQARALATSLRGNHPFVAFPGAG